MPDTDGGSSISRDEKGRPGLPRHARSFRIRMVLLSVEREITYRSTFRYVPTDQPEIVARADGAATRYRMWSPTSPANSIWVAWRNTNRSPGAARSKIHTRS
jgi:hypothetical protein